MIKIVGATSPKRKTVRQQVDSKANRASTFCQKDIKAKSKFGKREDVLLEASSEACLPPGKVSEKAKQHTTVTYSLANVGDVIKVLDNDES